LKRTNTRSRKISLQPPNKAIDVWGKEKTEDGEEKNRGSDPSLTENRLSLVANHCANRGSPGFDLRCRCDCWVVWTKPEPGTPCTCAAGSSPVSRTLTQASRGSFPANLRSHSSLADSSSRRELLSIARCNPAIVSHLSMAASIAAEWRPVVPIAISK
jgi:hypothetical protein